MNDVKSGDWYPVVGKPLPKEHVVTKWHYDAFEDTDLDLLLRVKGIKNLLFTGFTTNVCVETTARHGCVKGYQVILVSDCADAPTEREHESAVFSFKNYFGKIATSDELFKIWTA